MKHWKNLIFLFFFISCGQDYNSNSFDDEVYTITDIDTSDPAGARFAAAYEVIQDNCISCHTSYHNSYASLTSSENWTDPGLITKGDFENSFVIKRLKNYGGDMPSGASQLTDDNISILRDWVENIP